MNVIALSKTSIDSQAVISNNFGKDDKLQFIMMPVHKDFDIDVGAYIIECINDEKNLKDINSIFAHIVRKFYDMLDEKRIVKKIR